MSADGRLSGTGSVAGIAAATGDGDGLGDAESGATDTTTVPFGLGGGLAVFENPRVLAAALGESGCTAVVLYFGADVPAAASLFARLDDAVSKRVIQMNT